MTSPVEACMLILERSVWVRKEQQTLQAAMCGGSWTTRGNCGPLAADEPGHEPGAGVVLGIRRVYLVVDTETLELIKGGRRDAFAQTE